MRKIVIDTNLYISFLKTGKFSDTLQWLYTFRTQDIFFSSIVVEELLHGALDEKGKKLVETLYKPFEKVGRILTPTHQDWVDSGNLLSKINRKQKNLKTKTTHLLHDTLIALSTRRVGGVVYTSNAKDFELIAKYKDFYFEAV